MRFEEVVSDFEEIVRVETADLGYQLQIERHEGRIAGADDSVVTALRATLIFRRGGTWKISHRQADPGNFPVLVVSATEADPGGEKNQRYWLRLSPHSRQVVIQGPHDLQEVDPSRSSPRSSRSSTASSWLGHDSGRASTRGSV